MKNSLVVLTFPLAFAIVFDAVSFGVIASPLYLL